MDKHEFDELLEFVESSGNRGCLCKNGNVRHPNGTSRDFSDRAISYLLNDETLSLLTTSSSGAGVLRITPKGKAMLADSGYSKYFEIRHLEKERLQLDVKRLRRLQIQQYITWAISVLALLVALFKDWIIQSI